MSAGTHSRRSGASQARKGEHLVCSSPDCRGLWVSAFSLAVPNDAVSDECRQALPSFSSIHLSRVCPSLPAHGGRALVMRISSPFSLHLEVSCPWSETTTNGFADVQKAFASDANGNR